MMSILLIWLLTAASLMATSYLVPGFQIASFGGAMIAAIVIGLLNAILRPLLLLLTLPLNIITLGLFTFVINAIILKLAAGMMSSFAIDGWGPALLGAVILALVNMLVTAMFH